MEFVILFMDGNSVTVDVTDYITVRADGNYVEADGELYGSSVHQKVKKVSTAHSERPIEPES